MKTIKTLKFEMKVRILSETILKEWTTIIV